MRRIWINPTDLRSFLFYLMTVVLFSQACVEDRVGCLDPAAVNYDIEADKDGDCEYPLMSLEISRVYMDDTIDFNPGDAYISPQGYPFIPVETRYYISNIILEDPEGNQLRVADLLDFCYMENGLKQDASRIDDIALVRADRLRYEIGSFRHTGSFSLSLDFGIEDRLNRACRNELPEGHPLGQSTMFDEAESIILDLSLSVIPDTNRLDDTLVLSGIVPPRTADLTGTLEIPGGNDFIVPLQLDYYAWFYNVDFRNDEPEDIITKLSENYSGAIRLD